MSSEAFFIMREQIANNFDDVNRYPDRQVATTSVDGHMYIHLS